MELILFVVFLSLSLILVALGLFRPEHTELSLVGFVFLFLLSFTIMTNSIQYQTGLNTTYSYSNLSGLEVINQTAEINTYSSFSNNTHYYGYYLAIASVIGFIGVLLGLAKDRRIF